MDTTTRYFLLLVATFTDVRELSLDFRANGGLLARAPELRHPGQCVSGMGYIVNRIRACPFSAFSLAFTREGELTRRHLFALGRSQDRHSGYLIPDIMTGCRSSTRCRQERREPWLWT